MHIFEFKRPDGRFELLDLESIQWIHPLHYVERPYGWQSYKPWRYDDSKGYENLRIIEESEIFSIDHGRWEGSFDLTLMLQEKDRRIEHSGTPLPQFPALEALQPYYATSRPTYEQVVEAINILNAQPDIFSIGHDFCYEYERLVAAWKALPNRNELLKIVR